MRISNFVNILSTLAIVSGLATPVARAQDSNAADNAADSTSVTRTTTTTTTEANGSQTQTSASKTQIQVKTSVAKHRPRVGLALGGGGSRGSAHVGVLKVLLEEGIPIDIIAGTSIGSVVGGFYCAGMTVEQMEAQFDNDTFIKEFMPMSLPMRLVLAPIIFTPRLVGYHPYDGLYKGTKFNKYANKVVGSDGVIDKFKIPFAAVVTNVVDGSSCRLMQGDLGTALQASTAVPGLKKPVQIGDKLYCDGGLVCNLPVSHVRDMGADFVIAVDIDEYLNQVPLGKFRAAGSMSQQALRIQLASTDKQQGRLADIVIHPDTTGITLISRKKSDARRGIEAGIKAARDAMPEIKKKLEAIGITPTRVSTVTGDTKTAASSQ